MATKKISLDLSKSEIAARKAAGIPLNAELTESEIKNRESEKQSLLASVGFVPPAAETQTVAVVENKKTGDTPALIRAFVAAGAAPQVASADTQREEAEAFARPLLIEARSLETRHGILKREYLTRVEHANGTDWPTFIASVPEELTWDATIQGGVGGMASRNHSLIRRYRAAAELALAGLKTTFGDSQQGKEIKPANLSIAAQAVESALVVGATHRWDTDLDGAAVRVMTAGFREGVANLRWWAEKIRPIVEETARACAKFDEAELLLREMLLRVSPQPAAKPVKIGLAQLPPPPKELAAPTSSYVDFDPREKGGA
jgi:hypothetical protein